MTGLRTLMAGFVGVIASGTAWAQEEGYNPAPGWDHLWNEILIDITVIGVVFGAVAVYMLFKFKAKSPDDVGKGPKLSKAQAISWALIPAAVFMADDFFLSAKGWDLWNVYRNPPEDAMEVKVTAYQWYWEFTYENGITTDELVVPAGKPVVLRMSSEDVIHSFYIPKYRVKEDVMPGRVTYVWFRPEEGKAIATCTEYCGLAHANMPVTVVGKNQADYDAWMVEQQASAAPAAAASAS